METIQINKKTKIVTTLGPATQSKEMLTAIINAGMNVARINMSHGEHEQHALLIKNTLAVSKKLNIPVAILQDLSGPKIRIGEFSTPTVNLVAGEYITLTTVPCVGNSERVFINYKTLPQEIKKGGFIMLDDGKKKLIVEKITDTDVLCKIIVGGETKGRRGVNLPGAYLKISSITDKDKKDLIFGISQNVDFVALSFVRSGDDIDELRSLLKKHKSDAQIIAKIETQEAVDNLESIIEKTDGVMVARGDLAIEIGPEQVPIVQKKMIRLCNMLGKPVITATQMLESMIHSPVPTRAEVSDIANAILDGTDAVMLSEETALGEFPVEAVSVMTKVALQIEQGFPQRRKLEALFEESTNVVDAVTNAVVHTAHSIHAKAIVVLTESGFTARMIARHRPSELIYVLTPHIRTYNKLALSFGCVPVQNKFLKGISDDECNKIKKFIHTSDIAQKGDKVILSLGLPSGAVGSTNTMIVLTI
ncbi:MAG: pyruvate kinase [Candidatus Nomurabacteria bacterium]|nr:pyruvate kinase [Candidatus Nomurabacteria bacterium]